MDKSIPKLYETDGTPFDNKIIYQKWTIPGIGFYWLIAEIDEKGEAAFGYANLNTMMTMPNGATSVSRK